MVSGADASRQNVFSLDTTRLKGFFARITRNNSESKGAADFSRGYTSILDTSIEREFSKFLQIFTNSAELNCWTARIGT